MTRKKVTYIVSDIDKSLAFEWTARRLREFYDLKFVLIGKPQSALATYLNEIGIPNITLTSRKTIQLWLDLFRILRQQKPDIVHTHLWRANIIGLTASWLLGIKKRIYTRHHAMVHYHEFPSGRKWDILCNALATDIIAISRNIRHILTDLDHADESRIHIVPHGFDVPMLTHSSEESVQALRKKYNLQIHRPVVGVIARYLEWKGIQYIIPAFKNILRDYPAAKLILANASGNYQSVLRDKLDELPANTFQEIVFENDLSSLYRTFDVFVHTPIDEQSEAFGQTYVEALLCGVPSVFTLSGIAPEFVVNGKNAMVVPFRNSEAIHLALQRLLESESLRSSLIHEGRISASKFSVETMVESLRKIYE